jgi:hypothetical protein
LADSHSSSQKTICGVGVGLSAHPTDDYIFVSETMKGEQPYWPDNLMKRYIKPVARANGIYKNIGCTPSATPSACC